MLNQGLKDGEKAARPGRVERGLMGFHNQRAEHLQRLAGPCGILQELNKQKAGIEGELSARGRMVSVRLR